MAYFERMGLKDTSGNQINPTQDESLTLLRAIFKLLKPLGFITGSGSNRLNVDVNNITTLPTLGTVTTVSGVTAVTTVTTVTTTTNLTNLATSTFGPSPTFEFLKAMSRTGYNTGIRSNIT